MFVLKKIISQIFSPAPLCLEILLVGLFFLWFTRKQKTGKIIASIGVFIFLVMSYDGIPNVLIKQLESKYPPLCLTGISDTAVSNDISSVKWIVVLGGGHISDPKIPITSQISGATLVRLIEGIRLHKKIPGSKIILSEGKVFDVAAGSEAMAEVAKAIGISQEDLILESESKDTADEARIIKPMIGDDKFILVTSAVHMPRSVAMFERLGMYPIPAPTDYLVIESQGTSPGDFFPNPGGMRRIETALHEYVGLVWAKLRGQI